MVVRDCILGEMLLDMVAWRYWIKSGSLAVIG